jgi:hypothetical protein
MYLCRVGENFGGAFVNFARLRIASLAKLNRAEPNIVKKL